MTLRELLEDVLGDHGCSGISEMVEQLEDMVHDWYNSHYVLINKVQDEEVSD